MIVYEMAQVGHIKVIDFEHLVSKIPGIKT